ncbi:MAG: molybdopterin-binding/glycosyltransferase family 2 protein [Pseudomonadota bacterium]|nr:molybdopterin-binding/glycosyltransferase family 2 protein [Pseudomonadota bacterium]
MKFGETPLDEAAGVILAHSLRFGNGSFRKGRVLTADDISTLRAAGLETVVAIRLDADDLGENEAAGRIAAACQGINVIAKAPYTGRANLVAATDGILRLKPRSIHRINEIDEAITLSTLPPFSAVRAGQMIATVKIITFGIPEKQADECAALARDAAGMLSVAPYRPVSVGLIQTITPGLKESLLVKGLAATRTRLDGTSAELNHDLRCGHDVVEIAASLKQLSASGCDIALVLGASAIVDRRDVVPVAVEAAGGAVDHFGMPVDPGQLMMLARIGEMTVLGLPGSARSPRLHGFDWVVQRLLAGIRVTGDDLTAMGVGGLLKEIPSRPMPRGESPESEQKARFAALILAAGQSRRMGRINKLLAEIDGVVMVARTADAVLAANVDPVIVVLGHESDDVHAALVERAVEFTDNPDYATGLASSLKAGIAALPDDIDGVVVCLGDMPRVTPNHLDALIAAFNPAEGRGICVPTFNGKRGNPVLWDRCYFEDMEDVAGDVGARHLIGAHEDAVFEVEMPDGGVLLDLDTPEAFAAHAKPAK